MSRIVVFGNSGSGKSTYACQVSTALDCPHLDLDTVAWDADAETVTRLTLGESARRIGDFLDESDRWVIEGAYADLLELVLPGATEVVFLNPGTAICVENARNRPWEPHKYASVEAQDANLAMLVGWIRQYDQRDDEYSLRAHRRLFDDFDGAKRELTSNARPDAWPANDRRASEGADCRAK